MPKKSKHTRRKNPILVKASFLVEIEAPNPAKESVTLKGRNKFLKRIREEKERKFQVFQIKRDKREKEKWWNPLRVRIM